jgi:hypothetical protein
MKQPEYLEAKERSSETAGTAERESWHPRGAKTKPMPRIIFIQRRTCL